MFTNILKSTLETAAAKALATNGPEGINVVPVSMIRVNENDIWLFDFFMDKTAKNAEAGEKAALTAWTDMVGVQIIAELQYVTSGSDFEEAVTWVKTQNASRVVKGLLILRPTKVYDISPGGAFTVEDLSF